MSSAAALVRELKRKANPKKAALLSRFFKTGKGEYGEGDVFLGIMVPESRIIVRQFRDLPLEDVLRVLDTKFHEQRLVALLILVEQFRIGTPAERKKIFDAYLSSTRFINNWDLVDLSAGKIVGEYLVDRSKTILRKLAKSKDLWERRIAIIATSAFIARRQFDDTFAIADLLLRDKHDLIHKAVGWMLREVGKRDHAVLVAFLETRAHVMPRTMLRYAIERFPERERKRFLSVIKSPYGQTHAKK